MIRDFFSPGFADEGLITMASRFDAMVFAERCPELASVDDDGLLMSAAISSAMSESYRFGPRALMADTFAPGGRRTQAFIYHVAAFMKRAWALDDGASSFRYRLRRECRLIDIISTFARRARLALDAEHMRHIE